MGDMILKDTATVHVNNPKQIKEKHVRDVSEIWKKGVNFVFKKRRLMNNIRSIPYGFD